MEELTIQLDATCDKVAILDELMHTYGQDILRLVYTYVHNETIAEDLTQEIFVKCYQSLTSYKEQSSIKTWLWRIAINHSKDYLKSWYRRKVTTTDYDTISLNAAAINVEQTVIQREEDEQLADTVINLPVKYREVIYLFYFEEQPIKDIGAIIGANQNTVKTRLRKGKQLLKKSLEGQQWMTD
ncbi:sigma-70 family RNA polymerase sigma factor [Solibacillus sp. CAU 1738]|uniref:sigma-70 family RNA polymerase sigma factor n=1 Tax=Solibacillus sp. CAU 1738 TaxID=3140363 RepID=UPI0032615936